MPEKISAGGLLEKLGLKRKKPAEAPAAGILPVGPAETLAAPEMPAAPLPAPVLESAPAITPEPTATETPSPAPEIEAAAPEGELPNWLSAPSVAEPIPAPEPAAPPVMEAPVVEVPAVEAPVAPSAELPAPVAPALETSAAPPAVEAEKSPEQLAIEQFEKALLSADEALAKLRVGESLNETQLRAAMAAAATANGLIRNLPEHYLRVLLASRRLGENRDYNRLDFQKDMMAAIRVFSQANKG